MTEVMEKILMWELLLCVFLFLLALCFYGLGILIQQFGYMRKAVASYRYERDGTLLGRKKR